MVHFNFIAGNKFELDDFKSIDKFVESYSVFQTVFLKNEEELTLLLKLLGIEEINSQKLSNSEFSKYWDLSNFKVPEFNEKQFDEFYENWIKDSNRENSMDEYGSLIFLQGLSQKWNNLAYRIIVQERETK